MTTTIIGRAWRRVKAWLRDERPVVLEIVPAPLVCRRCQRAIDPADLFVFNSQDYHRECLWSARGYHLNADNPAEVVPNRSIHRFDAEREVWPDAPAGARLN